MFTAKEARTAYETRLAETNKEFQLEVSQHADKIENEIKAICDTKTHVEIPLPRKFHKVIGTMFKDAGYKVSIFESSRDSYEDEIRIEW